MPRRRRRESCFQVIFVLVLIYAIIVGFQTLIDSINESALAAEQIDFVVAIPSNHSNWSPVYTSRTMFADDWGDWAALRYLLRSIDKFAPWARRVHLVVGNASDAETIASRFDVRTNPRLRMASIVRWCLLTNKCGNNGGVSHDAILANLLQIEGLSKRFVYMQHDMFLLRPVNARELFYGPDKHYVFHNASLVMQDLNGAILDSALGRTARYRSVFAPMPMDKSVLELLLVEPRLRNFIANDAAANMRFLYGEYALASGKAVPSVPNIWRISTLYGATTGEHEQLERYWTYRYSGSILRSLLWDNPLALSLDADGCKAPCTAFELSYSAMRLFDICCSELSARADWELVSSRS